MEKSILIWNRSLSDCSLFRDWSVSERSTLTLTISSAQHNYEELQLLCSEG